MSELSIIHVILADYDHSRIKTVADSLVGKGLVVHTCQDRIEALGKYWMLYSEGILPRAVVASWLMETPDSRSFFTAIGREVDHTSLALFTNIARLDPDGILICYTDDLPETVTEFQHSPVADKVQVISTLDAYHEVARLLRLDDRSNPTPSKTSGNISGLRVAVRSPLSR